MLPALAAPCARCSLRSLLAALAAPCSLRSLLLALPALAAVTVTVKMYPCCDEPIVRPFPLRPHQQPDALCDAYGGHARRHRARALIHGHMGGAARWPLRAFCDDEGACCRQASSPHAPIHFQRGRRADTAAAAITAVAAVALSTSAEAPQTIGSSLPSLPPAEAAAVAATICASRRATTSAATSVIATAISSSAFAAAIAAVVASSLTVAPATHAPLRLLGICSQFQP